MAYIFSELQDEVKRRATRNQAGTDFDDAAKRAINFSIFRTSREARWKQLRRKITFSTISTYSQGSGAGSFTNIDTGVSVTGATFLTDNIDLGRRVKLSGDSTYHTVKRVISNTRLYIESGYSGTTTTTGTYSILPQEEYNLPVQIDTRSFLWHEQYGTPMPLIYVPDMTFYEAGFDLTTVGIPEAYRMWTTNMVKSQPKNNSVMTVVSSSASDTSQTVTISGTVSGYPDFETISLNGTTAVNGSKTFDYGSIDKVTKNATTTGRVTVTADSGSTTVAVIPVGYLTAGVMYSKIQLWPLPDEVFDMNIQYYKQPWRLVGNTDVHDLGQEFDETIILLAVAKINFETSKKDGDKFYALWKDEIRSLKKTNVDKIDWFPKLHRPGSMKSMAAHPYLSYRQAGSYFGPASRF